MIKFISICVLLFLLVACDYGIKYKVQNRMESIENSRISDSLKREFEKSMDTIYIMHVTDGDTTFSYELK